jgi:hypothetical protein
VKSERNRDSSVVAPLRKHPALLVSIFYVAASTVE